ncbi:MAG TPA: hypothetical protein VMI32_21515 [Candidatus Solibacter sp.]|nr:hypothetical protein [Candidatus Solibacter sp.]
MATTVREYSLDYYLLDRLKYSGIERDNLEDLVNIVASLKNKYGIAPYAVIAQGQPVANGLIASYLIETLTLNKVLNVLLDTPRLQAVSILPRGIPKSNQFEVEITIGD